MFKFSSKMPGLTHSLAKAQKMLAMKDSQINSEQSLIIDSLNGFGQSPPVAVDMNHMFMKSPAEGESILEQYYAAAGKSDGKAISPFFSKQ